MTAGKDTTVLFADLTGSTGVFQALGNELATKAVTSLTQWIAQVCVANDGRVVKMLGDGVLALFPNGVTAVAAAVELQRGHARRLAEWPDQIRFDLQIGIASGEVVEVDGDCYGDAVNVAARLSDLSGAGQVWATESTVKQCHAGDGVRFLGLGPVPVRGRSGATTMYRVEWREDVQSTNLTVPAALTATPAASTKVAAIELSWLDQAMVFSANRMPVNLGRDGEADFTVNDQRVSRLHAKVDWRHGNFVLADLSSYGTWVRFSNAMEFSLRRSDCVLMGSGEIALGASFEDFTVPTVSFRIDAGR